MNMNPRTLQLLERGATAMGCQRVGALLCVAPSVDSWKKEDEPEGWSGLSVSIDRVWHPRWTCTNPGMSGTSRFVWRHRAIQLLALGRLYTPNQLSSPDQLVALTDKCHPTLQRS